MNKMDGQTFRRVIGKNWRVFLHIAHRVTTDLDDASDVASTGALDLLRREAVSDNNTIISQSVRRLRIDSICEVVLGSWYVSDRCLVTFFPFKRHTGHHTWERVEYDTYMRFTGRSNDPRRQRGEFYAFIDVREYRE